MGTGRARLPFYELGTRYAIRARAGSAAEVNAAADPRRSIELAERTPKRPIRFDLDRRAVSTREPLQLTDTFLPARTR